MAAPPAQGEPVTPAHPIELGCGCPATAGMSPGRPCLSSTPSGVPCALKMLSERRCHDVYIACAIAAAPKERAPRPFPVDAQPWTGHHGEDAETAARAAAVDQVVVNGRGLHEGHARRHDLAAGEDDGHRARPRRAYGPLARGHRQRMRVTSDQRNSKGLVCSATPWRRTHQNTWYGPQLLESQPLCSPLSCSCQRPQRQRNRVMNSRTGMPTATAT